MPYCGTTFTPNNHNQRFCSYQCRWDNRAKVEWQGAVIAEPHSGWYLVQLFEWASGAPTEQRLVPIEKMISWSFYPDGRDDVWLKT